MNMNRTNKFLMGLLAVQVVLAVIIFRPHAETKAAGEPLLEGFASDQVSHLQIQDDTGKEIILDKTVGGDWVMTNYDSYPVDTNKVVTLLNKIEDAQTNRLITHSETSQRRLKVADDEYLRRIDAKAGDQTYTFYIGNPVGGNAAHVRVESEDPVYLVDDLRATDANTTLSSWINTTYFTAASENVVSVTVENPNGTFEFTKDADTDTWSLTSPSGDREADASKISSFMNQVLTLRMQEPISRELDDVWGFDTPQATVTITVEKPAEATPTSADSTAADNSSIIALPTTNEEESAENASTDDESTDGESQTTDNTTPQESAPTLVTYTYQIGTEQENGFVAKSSESDYYVRISSTVANGIISKILDNFLVEPSPTPTPAAAEDTTN